MPRRLVFLCVCLLATPALAQQREAGLSAEATETIRLQPDTAKIYFAIETKDPEVSAATDANTKLKKDLTDALDKLAIKGLATKAMQKTVARERESTRVRGGGAFPAGGQPVPVVDNISVSTPVVVTLTGSDSAKLVEMVEKVLEGAATLGISGVSANDPYSYNPFNQLSSGKARVVYSTKNGWEGATDAALAKATARAKEKIASLAKGAGVSLGELLNVQEVTGPSSDGPYVGPAYARMAEETGLVDGELVKTIRVRVIYAVK